ncbi:hypothetical protein G6F70_007034 [Rhizopus microsporus]|nr:hypothetical protein G6F71_006952 [Rhizopus microsporus]KAG1196935.1 hypothetical protein G6F70_007034 [Rhizopus microsporus]KAG1208802.1 hypothetical protein G6F69_006899 [Rhizopus microsporus]KAG1230181.1 hypothetical protein G6F67_006634 [Rhizopus microsporus]KAG1262385.1 hypothetical protein G6F68_005987 [Rhizopus microsporus]
MKQVEMTKKGLLSRPLDLIYFVYFASHIPVTLAIDLQTLLPAHWIPKVLADTLSFYKNTFKDPFMGSTEPMYWFRSFLVCELILQLPFFFYACYGLVKDCKRIRLPLAVYGAHVATTVIPTIAEVMFNPKYPLVASERLTLFGFYFPYFLLPLIMAIDSCIVVHQQIATTQKRKVYDSYDASIYEYGGFYDIKTIKISFAYQSTILFNLCRRRILWAGLSDIRDKIQSYVMAAANSWGLFLVIIFMGYGLVSVPRHFWHHGDFMRHLLQHYANAAKLKEEYMDSELELNEVAKIMNAISKRTHREIPRIRECIHIMIGRFPFVTQECYSGISTSGRIPSQLTEDYLVKLSRRMILAIRMRNRKKALWNNLLEEAFYLQDIIKNKDTSERRFTSTLRVKKNDTKWNTFQSAAEWWWAIRIAPLLYRILAIIFSVIGVFIIWSELTFNVKSPTLSIVSWALKACGTNYAAVEFMAFLTITYMFVCVYSSLFKIRFFNLYLLIPNHHTDENSLLWFTGYMCKMMAPLCYNFINLAGDAPFKEAPASDSVFSTFMGKADLFEFLGAFVDWFPVVILIPSLLLFFNLQDRFLSVFGIKNVYKSNDEDVGANESGRLLDADYEEGKYLVLEERTAREKEINPELRVSSRRRPQSPPHIQAFAAKYSRLSQPESSRDERNRKINELLEGRLTAKRYRDNSAASSTLSLPSESAYSDTVKLKTKSFGDTMKQKIDDIYNSFKSNTDLPSQNQSSSAAFAQSPPMSPRSSSSSNNNSRGRVFGRRSTESNNRGTGYNNEYHPTSSEANSEHVSHNPSVLGIHQTRNHSSSPFIRHDDPYTNDSNESRPNNMFDDI